MAIRSVEAIPLTHTLQDGRSFGGTRGMTDSRSTTLVRIETDDGTVGWGEAFASPRAVAALVEDVFADAVVGLSPSAAESLAERVYTGDIGGYHVGRQAFTQCALTGVETAMWDVRGKQVGEPVHTLLSGQTTDSVVPYASTMYITEWDQDPAEPMEEAKSEGFTAAKIKIGRNLEDDYRRVSVAREILGDDAHLMVDYNGNYTPRQAIKSIQALSEFDLTWVEEPVPPENVSGYREIKRHVDVPLAAGEAHFGRFDFKELIDERLVDIIQPNLGQCGGFSEARFLAKLAATENVLVRPHVWNSGVGTAAALQFAASLPDYPHAPDMAPEPLLFEFDRSENPLRQDILETPFDIDDGILSVPQKPGLGISVDEDRLEEYRI
ncbi:mandelate racemase/muconate lactonizing enzyme family protein [Halobacteria archaeon AArc-m2/3/4]|uniref:Mandelate racemase/muconate lactonizing enzyme family protein n=1 Tax=Natronoglomus mannanivorans TaxID=2979990 RepID=A0AAP2YZG8_9EURY|nr:mandelate racemase/muconate lactonizing enzyme family protein [Halobacteria archaeon AArc-xg1-1]MCU4973510.1 mandelate racemase/muconate lactonizing enzyme family protein [Halobacteria archaeon AArc-m2/3/4]